MRAIHVQAGQRRIAEDSITLLRTVPNEKMYELFIKFHTYYFRTVVDLR